jgi:superfamily II DNA/RNA helicase
VIIFYRVVVVVTSKNRDTVTAADIRAANVLVGTACAGTGVDIGSVALVVVVGLPFNIEVLLQWAGRLRNDGTIVVIVPRSHMSPPTELSRKDWV